MHVRSGKLRWHLIALAVAAALVIGMLPGTSFAKSATFTGDDITIATINPLSGNVEQFPWVADAVKAAAKAVNDNGGVRGKDGKTHKLVVLSCDDQFTAAGGAECGRKVVDAKAIAVVGNDSGVGDSYGPPIVQAGIPIIGTNPNSGTELFSNLVFPIIGGSAVSLTGWAALSKALGCKKPVALSVSAAEFLTKTFYNQLGLNKYGLDGTVIPIPTQNPNYDALAASATAGGGDCVSLIAGIKDAQALIPALANTGTNPKIFYSSFSISPAQLKELGSAANNVYVLGFLKEVGVNPNASYAKRIKKEMKAFNSGGKYHYGGDMYQAWATTHLLAEQILPKLDTLDAATLAAYLPTAGTITIPGLAPFDWGKPDGTYKTGTSQFRVFNNTIVVYKNKNGKLQPLFGGKLYTADQLAKQKA